MPASDDLRRMLDASIIQHTYKDRFSVADLEVFLAIVLAKLGAIGQGYIIDRREFHELDRYTRMGTALIDVRNDPIYDGFRLEVNPDVSRHIQVPPKQMPPPGGQVKVSGGPHGSYGGVNTTAASAAAPIVEMLKKSGLDVGVIKQAVPEQEVEVESRPVKKRQRTKAVRAFKDRRLSEGTE